jgi:hypothetical protein
VERASKQFQSAHADPGFINSLLSAQSNFNDFYKRFTGVALDGIDLFCRSKRFALASKQVRIDAFNTALLSQRDEKVGALLLPLDVLRSTAEGDPDADLSISIYHHPDAWLDPGFRRAFRKLLESISHFVFSGHEHQRDAHWSESSSCEHVTLIEADALQESSQPTNSGFNCLVLDFEHSYQKYWYFKWKQGRYTANPDGLQHPTQLLRKTAVQFAGLPSFIQFLTDDDFGFTHPRLKKLLLADIFVYPALTVEFPKSAAARIKGPNVFGYILKTKFLYIRGQDYCGKTALLKTIAGAFLEKTTIVPIFLSGSEVTAKSDDAFVDLVKRTIRRQYGPDLVEPFLQLPLDRRALLIDDFQQTRLGPQAATEVLKGAKQYFGTIIVTSTSLPAASELSSVTEDEGKEPLLTSLSINELPPSSRGEITDRWLRIGQSEPVDEAELARELEREQELLNDLIRKKALPALPYLVVGAIQIRHGRTSEGADPGSFGYLFEKLVIDALSITASPREKHIERKDRILRRFAFHLFQGGTSSESVQGFESLVTSYKTEMMINVNAPHILEDLLAARILVKHDGNISFRQSNFFYYFVARNLLDKLDGSEPETARAYLNDMAERPLDWANRLTLMFVLFFRKTDPIIDHIIDQANITFSEARVSDITSDVKFIDDGLNVPAGLVVNENVDLAREKKRRYEQQDEAEDGHSVADATIGRLPYSDDLDLPTKIMFAIARMELLGQVIRNFSGSLEGKRKIEILVCVFRLGLRLLSMLLTHLKFLHETVGSARAESEETRKRLQLIVNDFIPLVARLYCDSILLTLSRSVGVRDIEEAYELAATQVGDTCATLLVDLAIKLDHSAGFPLKRVETAYKRVSKESRVATAVLRDIVVRNTQIYPLQHETLRRIAGIIEVRPISREFSARVRSMSVR